MTLFLINPVFSIYECEDDEKLGEIIDDSYYCVKPGDGIKAIFDTFEDRIKFDSYEAFVSGNKVTHPKSWVYIGQKLHLSPPPLISRISNPFSSNFEPKEYTVVEGDTLTRIYNNRVAKEYEDSVSWNEFIKWNIESDRINPNNLDLINPGDNIIIGSNQISSTPSQDEIREQQIDKTDLQDIVEYMSEEFNISSYYIFSYIEFLETQTDASLAFIITNENDSSSASNIAAQKLQEFEINQFKDRYFFLIIEEFEDSSVLYYNKPSFSNFLNEFLSSFRDTSQALDSAEEAQLLLFLEKEQLEQKLNLEVKKLETGESNSFSTVENIQTKINEINEEITSVTNNERNTNDKRNQEIENEMFDGEIEKLNKNINELNEEISNIEIEIEEKQIQLRGDNRPDDISNINVEELRGDIRRLEELISNKESEKEKLEKEKSYLIENEQTFSQNKLRLKKLYKDFKQNRSEFEDITREGLANDNCPANRYSNIQFDIQEINELYQSLTNMNYLNNEDIENFEELFNRFKEFQNCLIDD